jgi:hypothetical protein
LQIDTLLIFLHSCIVTLKFRRFFAFVLLVLLPLQATAVVTICPHSKLAAASVSAAAPAADHCLHGSSGAVLDQRADGQGEQNPQSCCAAISACAMCTVAVSMQRLPRVKHTPQTSDFFLSSQFTSFIPEGLQRPPSILA